MELTKDMIGDLFMTREGKVVCLEHWFFGGVAYPAVFVEDTNNVRRTVSGAYWELGSGPRDVIKHLTRSKYPEYYL